MSLSIRNLHITLGDCRLHEINLQVESGEYFVLLGESGAGKSVLLETLAGFTPPVSGEILLEDEEITRAPIQARPFGIIYQDCGLFPHLSVRRNVQWGLRNLHLEREERRRRVAEAAAATGIEEILERSPTTLSGGEAQRVALARTLARRPRFLLLDEPLSSLDPTSRASLRALLRRLHREGVTFLHVTHSWEDAVSLADRIAVLENGTIVQSGTPQAVFAHPRTEFVARFSGQRNIYRGVLRANGDDTAGFVTGPVEFTLVTVATAGPGQFLLGSEEVLLSRERPATSARNCFAGRVIDLERVPSGFEVTVDIGVPVSARITRASVEELQLKPGSEVWISFKARAGTFIGD